MNTNNSLKIFHPVHVDGLKRLGGNYDGGYIVHFPSLKDAACLVNYGVGYNVNFEKDFYKATGISTLAFDPTLKSLSPILGKLTRGEFIPFLRHVKNYMVWMFKEGTLERDKIEFVEEGIADKNAKQYKTLAYHLEQYGLSDKKIILKMDVEGAEYPVLNDVAIYPLFGNVIQFIVEFHDVNTNMDNMFSIMNNLSKTHSLIHIHSNNHAGTFNYNGKNVPLALEATFLLNEYLPKKELAATTYPIEGLDQPCDRLKEDIVLDFFY